MTTEPIVKFELTINSSEEHSSKAYLYSHSNHIQDWIDQAEEYIEALELKMALMFKSSKVLDWRITHFESL